MKKVIVVMPAYNAEKTVADTYNLIPPNSVHETILVDDCSKDKTVEIAKELNNEAVDWQKEYADYILEGTTVFGSYVKEWYTGNLQTVFFEGNDNPEIKKQICAVLAGYVWDKTNPFVKNHNRLIGTVAHVIRLENG